MSNTKIVCLLLIFLTAAALLGAADADIARVLVLTDTRPYYTDLRGSYGLGYGQGETEETALRAAKAQALAKVFAELRKDSLFQGILIDSWPEKIQVVEQKSRETGEEMWYAAVRVLVEQHALLLADQQYRSAAGALLAKAESLSAQAELLIRKAGTQEENLALGQAFGGLSQALTLLDEAAFALKTVEDRSLQSPKGLTVQALRQSMEALTKSARESLDRINKAESAVQTARTQDTAVQSLELFAAELAKWSIEADKLRQDSPFFEKPKSELSHISINARAAVDGLRVVKSELERLLPLLRSDQSLQREKCLLYIREVETLVARYEQYNREAQDELNYPRLRKQADARRSAEFWNAVGETAVNLLLREPDDILVLHHELPFQIPTSGGIAGKAWLNGWAEIESGFPIGIWAKTRLFSRSMDFPQGGGSSLAISHELSMGFFGPWFLGVGFGWDWMRFALNGNPALRHNWILLHLGSSSQGRSRSDALLTLKYQLPQISGVFIFPYFVNFELNGRLKLDHLFIFDVGVANTTIQAIGGETPELARYGLRHYWYWEAGMGLRVPKAFTWGGMYRGAWSTAINGSNGSESANQELYNSWTIYLEYSF